MPAANNEPREERIMENFRALAKTGAKLPEVIDFLDENISVVSKEKAAEMLDRLEKLQQEFCRILKNDFIMMKLYKSNERSIHSRFDLGKVYEIEDEKVRELLSKTKKQRVQGGNGGRDVFSRY